MKKLSELKDDEALDLWADLIDPLSEIVTDKEVVNAFVKVNRLEGVKICIKKHKDALVKCLAAIEGVPYEEYHVGFWALPRKVLAVVNDIGKDPDQMDFFKSQGQEFMEGESSGSVTENGEAEA